MKKIGKHFFDELAAAGLNGLPFSVQENGVFTFGSNVTEEQRALILDVYEAHNAALPNFDTWLSDVVRPQRNQKLTDCDWTHVSDSPLSDEAQALWQQYRQALRDFPATLNEITDPIPWPAAPA